MVTALELVTFVDGVAWTSLRAPQPIAPRAWALGVVAVQVAVADGRLHARVRAHVTGGQAPLVHALAPPTVVQVQLVDGAAPPLPAIAPVPLDGAVARLALFADEVPIDTVALPALGGGPRAFGHVFCRWLRSGDVEPGFDLTDFADLPLGHKHERRVVRTIGAGHTISYALAWALS
jgi:hypothetical protein